MLSHNEQEYIASFMDPRYLAIIPSVFVVAAIITGIHVAHEHDALPKPFVIRR